MSVSFCTDPTADSRFFCSHAAGVHHITLPWLQKIAQFYATGNNRLMLVEDMDIIYNV